MAEMLKIDEQYAILTEAERAAPLRVLKHGDSFAVFDPHGDISPGPASPYGVYYAGTRFVSCLQVMLGNRQPLLLSSTIAEDNTAFTADLTNPDILQDGRVVLERGVLHLFRSLVVSNAGVTDRLRVSNHGLRSIEVPISIRFDADFADLFEVRGTRRSRRGERLTPLFRESSAVLRYRGLDNVERRAIVRTKPAPDRQDFRLRAEATPGEDGWWFFAIALEQHEYSEIEISISCEVGEEHRPSVRIEEPAAREASRAETPALDAGELASSNQAFNQWVRRSFADLQMMVTDTPYGTYPYAGIPWFSTPFGRDGILTAIELLWLSPQIARGVLTFLAETQATVSNDRQDAQPGKILHEMRDGEMAALGEIPFGRYYGSADATPLFVMLAAAYFERTGDAALIDRLWPHVLAALQWMDNYGDVDRDGFIEYARRSETGLIQQGWKDSWDSVFHADGQLADPPIALCELQGYAYAAWNGAARLATARGDDAQAQVWAERAAALQERFEQVFWCEELGSYALALDGRKQPCRVRTSNPGHCLFSGIVRPPRSRTVADTLMADTSFSGWGVRTVAAGMARYNPMSYHNGSVWPHDTAIVAAGFARYGLTGHALQLFTAMFHLSQAVELHRLPELICGFHRRTGGFPTLYPVACAPQSWAAGAVFLLLQACLGVHVDGTARQVSFIRSVLPPDIEWLRIDNLRVADASVDLLLRRYTHDVGITVLRREGDVEVVAVK
jgi:glycogen debranching enzyme